MNIAWPSLDVTHRHRPCQNNCLPRIHKWPGSEKADSILCEVWIRCGHHPPLPTTKRGATDLRIVRHLALDLDDVRGGEEVEQPALRNVEAVTGVHSDRRIARPQPVVRGRGDERDEAVHHMQVQAGLGGGKRGGRGACELRVQSVLGEGGGGQKVDGRATICGVRTTGRRVWGTMQCMHAAAQTIKPGSSSSPCLSQI